MKKTTLKPSKKKKKVVLEGTETTAESIFTVASKLFAEKGFDGVSTKEICTLAKANISSLHYHFETKEKLYFAILSKYTEGFQENMKPLLAIPESADELKLRLELFLENLYSYSMEHQEFTQIIYHEMGIITERSEPLLKIFFPIIEVVDQFFKGASHAKVISSEIDTKVLTRMFLKLMRPEYGEGSTLLNNKFSIQFHDPQVRQYYAKSTITILLNGILSRDKK